MKYLRLICAEPLMEQMPEADANKHYEEYRETHGRSGLSIRAAAIRLINRGAKRTGSMCPACITTVALMIAEATLASEPTVLVTKKLCANNGTKNYPEKPNQRRTHHDQQQHRVSESRLAR